MCNYHSRCCATIQLCLCCQLTHPQNIKPSLAVIRRLERPVPLGPVAVLALQLTFSLCRLGCGLDLFFVLGTGYSVHGWNQKISGWFHFCLYKTHSSSLVLLLQLTCVSGLRHCVRPRVRHLHCAPTRQVPGQLFLSGSKDHGKECHIVICELKSAGSSFLLPLLVRF